jgi:hypothetical protein
LFGVEPGKQLLYLRLLLLLLLRWKFLQFVKGLLVEIGNLQLIETVGLIGTMVKGDCRWRKIFLDRTSFGLSILFKGMSFHRIERIHLRGNSSAQIKKINVKWNTLSNLFCKDFKFLQFVVLF